MNITLFDNDKELNLSGRSFNRMIIKSHFFGLKEFTRYNLKTFKLMSHHASKIDFFRHLGGSWDYALPQDWLNEFHNKHGLDYDLVRCSCVWTSKGIISVCDEIQQIINNDRGVS